LRFLERFRTSEVVAASEGAEDRGVWARHAGSVLLGFAGLGFLMNLPVVYAVTGLLSISGFVLSRVLRRLRGNPYQWVDPPSDPIERSLVLSDAMDLEVTPEVDPKVMGLPRFFWERGSLRSVNEYP